MRKQLVVIAVSAVVMTTLGTSTAFAGEITGQGDRKPVNGNSPCAFSGQEDLQWFTDDGDGTRLENPVKGVPGHAQSWGQIPKAVRDAMPAEFHPGISCNPNRSTFGE